MPLLAAVAAASIIVGLKSGAVVNIDYSLTSNLTTKVLTLRDVNEKGRAIGEWIWNDYCKSDSGVRCDQGNGFVINLVLLPISCNAIISDNNRTGIGYYDCDMDLNPFRSERDIAITPR